MEKNNIFFGSDYNISEEDYSVPIQKKSSGRIVDKLAADGFKMQHKRKRPTKKKRKY